MFGFSKSKKKTKKNNEETENQAPQEIPAKEETSVKEEEPKKKGWFSRLRHGLKRTRSSLTEGIATLALGKKTIDDDLFEELETTLLLADVGAEATTRILSHLTEQVKRKTLGDSEALIAALREQLLNILTPCSHALDIPDSDSPFAILMVGVNGSGKTTSIAKLANYYKQQGKSVMLAAGDTFRAAAVEQLQVWGERNDVPVIAQQAGSDSASVIYDAMEAAKARKYDILIADTAGRLHTQSHLMNELEKIKRVMGKLDANAPHETMLILDASIGQNALTQAEQFHEAIKLNSISVTKLDGTAKGGIIFAIAEKMKLPIRFIGVGEQIDDLRPFDAEHFVNALFE